MKRGYDYNNVKQNISCHFSNRYSVTVDSRMSGTVKLLTNDFNLATRKSGSIDLLLTVTLYQENHDRTHKLWKH